MTLRSGIATLVALVVIFLGIAPAAHAHGVATVRVRTASELVAAINAANASGRPTIIKLAPGTYELTQAFDDIEVGPSALPPITGDIALVGADASNTILHAAPGQNTGGTGFVRILTVLKSGAALVRGLTLTGGLELCDVDRDICEVNGGGAAINAGGILWIDDSELDGNSAAALGPFPQYGGGVLSTGGYLVLTGATLTGNQSVHFGGGLAVLGGTAKISRSRIAGNRVRPGLRGRISGAGLYMRDAKVWIDESSIAGNRLPEQQDADFFGYGAGIYIDSGDLHLARSAITENTTPARTPTTSGLPGAGGGIANYRGRMWIKDSTIGGNTSGTYAGGILNSGTAFIEGSTIARNQALGLLWDMPPIPPGCTTEAPPDPEVCRAEGGGIWNEAPGVAHIARSIIALNVVNGTGPVDCGGDTPLISDGRNLIGDASGCTLTRSPGAGPDLLDVDPKLAELEDNGEAGEAHFPLIAGSPVIDAGGRLGRFCEFRDQLGARRADGNEDGKLECDIGAIEWHPSRH